MDYLDYEGLLRYDELIKKDISNKVIGPSSSIDTHVVAFDGTTGKLVKDSGFTIGKSVPSNAVFTDTTYSVMGASGSTHASGLVPDTPSVAGTTKYLREDGTWQTPPDNNTWRPVSDSISSTSSSDAASSKAVKTAYDLAASKTANTGTVTSVAVKMNGATKGTVTTSGTIDLGTVLTSHQNISGKADKTTTVNGHALSSNVTVTKSDVGLGNVTNDSQVKRSEMGVASGVATLDSNGKVPSSQLPSYVDDVIEGYFYNSKFYKESAHTTEITGETGKIYVDLSTNKTYRWGGSAYAIISETLALGETSSTAYRGDRGKTAYTHSQTTSGNPHNVTKSDVGLGNVGNFKAVSTVASQDLSDTEKANARANIGAGTSSFSGSYNDLSNKPTIPVAAANGTYTVKTLVGSTTTNVSDFTANLSSADDVTFVQGSNVTITPDATNRKITIAATDTTYSEATTSAAGLMSSSDKSKLNGIESGAQTHKAPTAAEVKFALGTGSGTSKYLREDGTWAEPTSGGISYTETTTGITNLDATLISTALRKTAQTLTAAEQALVKLNLGISLTRNIIISTSEPTSSDGNDGDIWLVYES